jgi:pimeloyl-ACP methyl ester carboxylesterase
MRNRLRCIHGSAFGDLAMALPGTRTVEPCLPAGTRVSFRSADGLTLHGSMIVPDAATCGVVLVHGGGVTREEGGFYTRLAAGLADAGLASLRFDLRAHGQSQGLPEDLTLCGAANDVAAAAEFLAQQLGADSVSLMAASFGGGLAVLHAARHPKGVDRLALINPLLHYQRRFIDQNPQRWCHGHLTDNAAAALARDGSLPHSATIRHGRDLPPTPCSWCCCAASIRSNIRSTSASPHSAYASRSRSPAGLDPALHDRIHVQVAMRVGRFDEAAGYVKEAVEALLSGAQRIQARRDELGRLPEHARVRLGHPRLGRSRGRGEGLSALVSGQHDAQGQLEG